MTKWEYRVETFDSCFDSDVGLGPDDTAEAPGNLAETYQRVLNDLGQEGWELVECTFSSTEFEAMAVLKKPIVERPESDSRRSLSATTRGTSH